MGDAENSALLLVFTQLTFGSLLFCRLPLALWRGAALVGLFRFCPRCRSISFFLGFVCCGLPAFLVTLRRPKSCPVGASTFDKVSRPGAPAPSSAPPGPPPLSSHPAPSGPPPLRGRATGRAVFYIVCLPQTTSNSLTDGYVRGSVMQKENGKRVGRFQRPHLQCSFVPIQHKHPLSRFPSASFSEPLLHPVRCLITCVS